MKKIFCIALFAQLCFVSITNAQTKETVFKVNITGGFIEASLLPTNNQQKLAIIIAGSGPTDRNGNNPAGVNSNSYKMLAEQLAKENIATIRYDKRGIAKSKMEKFDESKMVFSDFINDAILLYNYAKDSLAYKQIYFIGHSEGSLVGMMATQQTKASGYISISGAGRGIDEIIEEQVQTQPDEVKEKIHEIFTVLKEGKQVDDVPQYLYTLFRPSLQPYMISWLKYSPTQEIKKLNIPILIINGTCDKQVKESEAVLLHQANPNSQLLIIKNMTHALKDADEACEDEDMKTYTSPTLPLNNELTQKIIEFIQKN